MPSNEISRRDFLKQIGGASLAMLTLPRIALWAMESGSSAPKPNILFIFTDDHAVQSISAYGSRINQTPNIDRIARNGAIFENSFCANSICAPSRACVLTGKHSHKNGQRDNKTEFDGSQATFPKILQSAGYQTALIGKWHLKSTPTGFDHWEILPGQGSYYNPDFNTSDGKKRITGYCTDIITDKCLEWMKNCNESKPFLLLCQHKAPHRNWCPSPKHMAMYKDIEIPEPPTLFDDYSGRSEALKQNELEIARHMMMEWDLKITGTGIKDALGRDRENAEYKRMNPDQKKLWDAAYEPEKKKFLEAKLEGKDLVRWKYQRYMKDYLRCVASVDDNIGRMLDYLEQTGKMENTIVVYSSDQGFYLGEHGWYDKRWMYEESFRMPLLISWRQRIKPGMRINQLVQNIDYAPTFLDAAGADIPKNLDGDSMLPLFDEKNPDWRDALYYHYYEEGEHNVPPHDGVRDQRYKLIHFYKNHSWELFDLEKDPHELKSLWDDPQYSEVKSMMINRYHALRKQYDVPPFLP